MLQNSDSTLNGHGRKLLHPCEETAMVLCIGRAPGTPRLSPGSKRAEPLQPHAWTMLWWIVACLPPLKLAALPLTNRSLTTFHWSCFCSSLRLLHRRHYHQPRPPLPVGFGTAANEGPMQVPLHQGHARPLSPHAQLQPLHTAAANTDDLELADGKLCSAIDAAAQAAPLQRKRPWTGRQPPHLSCYAWWNTRCLVLQSQMRRAKLLSPRSPPCGTAIPESPSTQPRQLCSAWYLGVVSAVQKQPAQVLADGAPSLPSRLLAEELRDTAA